MEASQAKEDIQLIKEMIEKSKKSTAESGLIFIVWSILPILAIMTMYFLVYLEKYNLIWLNWVVFMGIGAVFSVIYSINRRKTAKVRTYTQIAIWHLWIACGLTFPLMGFVFPLMGLYSFEIIPIMVAVIAGIGIFTTGGIVEWNLLKWCGLVWLGGAIIMGLVHWHYRSLLFIPLILIGYLMPGLLLNKKYRNKENTHDDR
jgi:hypothetical protein